jgi:hypothetical protein
MCKVWITQEYQHKHSIICWEEEEELAVEETDGKLKMKQRFPYKTQVLMAVKMSMLVFWAVTLCGLVGIYQRFKEIYCLHLQHITTQKTNTDRKISYA